MRTIFALLNLTITIYHNYVFMLPFFHMYLIVELLLLLLEYISGISISLTIVGSD